jgi:DNA-binding response OmpR family regulator
VSKNIEGCVVILVVNDVEETRDALEQLLTSDGYCVVPARGENDAVQRTKNCAPALILLSLAGGQSDWMRAAERIRKRAELNVNVPIVLFCVEAISEGAEVEIAKSTYLTRPDNFNQLRIFLAHLLQTCSTDLAK